MTCFTGQQMMRDERTAHTRHSAELYVQRLGSRDHCSRLGVSNPKVKRPLTYY